MKSLKDLLDEAELRQSIVNEDNPYSKYYHMNNTVEPRTYDYPEIALLDKQISEVKKQLADRQAKYESVPQPKTQVGWGSYIANNDATLLNKYQDAERAWYNKLIDQAHAKELAKAQMEQQSAYQMDDNMKNRSLALNKLELAKSNLMNDTSNDQRTLDGYKKEFKDAMDELNYWNKRVGIESYKDEDKLLDKEITGDVNTAGEAVDYAGIKSFATEEQKQATISQAKSNPAYKTDANFRKTVNDMESIVPEDTKKAEQDKNIKKWLKEYQSLRAIEQSDWQKANPKKYKALQDRKLVL